MTEQQKKMLEDALKVLNSVFNSVNGATCIRKKSDLIDHTAYATAKIEDVLALEEEEEPEERPITAEDILGIGAKK